MVSAIHQWPHWGVNGSRKEWECLVGVRGSVRQSKGVDEQKGTAWLGGYMGILFNVHSVGRSVSMGTLANTQSPLGTGLGSGHGPLIVLFGFRILVSVRFRFGFEGKNSSFGSVFGFSKKI